MIPFLSLSPHLLFYKFSLFENKNFASSFNHLYSNELLLNEEDKLAVNLLMLTK